MAVGTLHIVPYAIVKRDIRGMHKDVMSAVGKMTIIPRYVAGPLDGIGRSWNINKWRVAQSCPVGTINRDVTAHKIPPISHAKRIIAGGNINCCVAVADGAFNESLKIVAIIGLAVGD